MESFANKLLKLPASTNLKNNKIQNLDKKNLARFKLHKNLKKSYLKLLKFYTNVDFAGSYTRDKNRIVKEINITFFIILINYIPFLGGRLYSRREA